MSTIFHPALPSGPLSVEAAEAHLDTHLPYFGEWSDEDRAHAVAELQAIAGDARLMARFRAERGPLVVLFALFPGTREERLRTYLRAFGHPATKQLSLLEQEDAAATILSRALIPEARHV